MNGQASLPALYGPNVIDSEERAAPIILQPLRCAPSFAGTWQKLLRWLLKPKTWKMANCDCSTLSLLTSGVEI
jgi:hypothetical protein